VGVIVNLALFFGYYVLWPASFTGQLDIKALLLGCAAALALFKFQQSIVRVLVFAGASGMLLNLFA
jgi:chromate transporter